jgi:hypothetical protein
VNIKGNINITRSYSIKGKQRWSKGMSISKEDSVPKGIKGDEREYQYQEKNQHTQGQQHHMRDTFVTLPEPATPRA